MDLRILDDKYESQYDHLVTHIMQSWQWGEFRKKMGITLLRFGLFKNNKLVTAFQLTLHPIPFLKSFVGYFPKGPFPSTEIIDALIQISQDHNLAFIKLEPNIESPADSLDPRLIPSPKPLFTKHNFVIDLTRSEEDLLKHMHPKTRYNIRVAQKKGVKTSVETSDDAFQKYLTLYFETTKRQGYFGHNSNYHKTVWETLKKTHMAQILLAIYQGEPITAWMLFNFKDTLYYPYGGSTTKYKEVMANNLIAWEAIKLGQQMKLKHFDMWGALGPDPNPKDPWIGFHRFKAGYGGQLVEYIGSFDLVTNPLVYRLFTIIDKSTSLKAALLKILGK